MLNGRWVPSDEIFEGVPPMTPSLQHSAAAGQTTEMPVHPAAAASVLAVSEEPDKQQRASAVKPLKELRFRQVLLSQTDHELSLLQV